MNPPLLTRAVNLVASLKPLIEAHDAARREVNKCNKLKADFINLNEKLIIFGGGGSNMPAFIAITLGCAKADTAQTKALEDINRAMESAHKEAGAIFGLVSKQKFDQAKAATLPDYGGEEKLADHKAGQSPDVLAHREFLNFINDKAHTALTHAHEIAAHCEQWIASQSGEAQ